MTVGELRTSTRFVQNVVYPSSPYVVDGNGSSLLFLNLFWEVSPSLIAGKTKPLPSHLLTRKWSTAVVVWSHSAILPTLSLYLSIHSYSASVSRHPALTLSTFPLLVRSILQPLTCYCNLHLYQYGTVRGVFMPSAPLNTPRDRQTEDALHPP
jgi:hypothetical protein